MENSQSGQEFGANEWLVDEMYGQWLVNPDSVDKEWQPILERYHQVKLGQPVTATPVVSAPVVSTPPAVEATHTGSVPLVAKTTRVEPKPQPIPA